jgi:hypothetical protein
VEKIRHKLRDGDLEYWEEDDEDIKEDEDTEERQEEGADTEEEVAVAEGPEEEVVTDSTSDLRGAVGLGVQIQVELPAVSEIQ